MWDWFTSASREAGVNELNLKKETRIRLLGNDILSFYASPFQDRASRNRTEESIKLNLTVDGYWHGSVDREQRMQDLSQLMRRRHRQRVGELRENEVIRLQCAMTDMLARLENDNDSRRSHDDIDWSLLTDTITQFYAKRLNGLQILLDHDEYTWNGTAETLDRWFAKLRQRSHTLLAPYFDMSTYERNGTHQMENLDLSSQLGQETFDRCKYVYTYGLRFTEPFTSTSQSDYHRQAVEEILHGICSILITVGFGIERVWRDEFDDYVPETGIWTGTLRETTRAWGEQIEELRAWLGWVPETMHCSRMCDWDVSSVPPTL
ncbi:hypothetical protein MMC25_004600 [Agyrium rufum]|nr:hypothetical protein [Agyrium rufum]